MSARIKLAVDGRNLTRPLSGIGRFISQTLIHLPKEKVSPTLLATRPINGYFKSLLDQHDIAVKNSKTRLGLPAYTETEEHVFWGPAHRIPFGLPKNLPVVLTVHDLAWRIVPHTMQRRTWVGERLFFARAVRRANRIACVSQATADDLARLFPESQDKTRIVYPAAFKSEQKPSKDKKKFALFVGTPEPRKNLQGLLKAYASMPVSQRCDLELVIVGGTGWGGIDVEAMIKFHGIDDKTRVILAPDDDQLNQLYADCAFLVLPSFYEGFGLPLVEAMSHGKPVITSNTASMPEVAGDAGLFIDPTDANSLATAMALLAGDTELYNTLSEQAKMHAQKFSWAKASVNMMELFEEVLQDRSR